MSDLRYAARSLARTPGLTFVLLLTIALGIGANASVVGFIRGSITRPLPLSDPDSVVSLLTRNSDGQLGPTSYERYLSLKAKHDSLRLLGAARESQSSIRIGDRTSVMSVAAVTPELADLLNLPLDDGVVVSHRVWELEFGRKARLSDTSIRLDRTDAPISAVAPEWLEGLYFGRPVDVWIPLHEEAIQDFNRSSHTFWLVGRLPPTISRDEAEEAANSNGTGDEVMVVLPYTGLTPDVAGGISRIRTLLPWTAGAVFMIACANVAGFLLSRASARAHERSIRIALGASRRHLGTQLLSESVLISLVGGAFAIVLAYWVARIIPALLFEQDAEHLEFALDVSGLLIASAVCAAITVVCGLVPLLEIRHDDPARVLQRESSGPSRSLRRLTAGLVITQMTCCCLLVILTALLIQGFQSALQTSAGHRVGQPILATLQSQSGFTRPDLGLEYFRNAEQVAQSARGVFATAWTGVLPGSRPSWYDMRIELPHLPIREVTLDAVTLTPRLSTLIDYPPIAGRMFGGGDAPGGCRVALLNQEAAEELFHGDAVGRVIEDSAGTHVEIVGVVAMRTPAGTSSGSRPTLYYYGEQIGSASDRAESSMFRVRKLSKTSSAMLAGNIVSASYFDAVGMSLIKGSAFQEDSDRSGCRTGVINQEAAELYFGGDAVGGAVIDAAGQRTEIVGVVQSSVLRASQRSEPAAIYFPIGQDFRPSMTLILSARTASDELLASLQRELEAVPGGDPGRVVVTTLDAHLSKTALAPERIAAVLVSACAATALALGVLGLYGALSDDVRHRRREIALRLALGARRRRITYQLLLEGVRLAGAGTVVGMVAAFVVTKRLPVIQMNTGPLSLWIWLAPPVVLLAAVAFASVFPMRRAISVNPVSLLRRN